TLDDLLGVLAHEVGHLFEVMTLGGNGQSLLSEGLASWAAGRYWIGMLGLASLRDAAAHYLETGMYIPLPQTLDELHLIYPRPDTTSGEECVARRDIVYTQWAAF